MRQLVTILATTLFFGAFAAGEATAAKMEVKGIHICCKDCASAITDALGNVKGLSDLSCDQKNQAVTFSVKDFNGAVDAFVALVKAGFAGQCFYEGKPFSPMISATAKGDAKTDTVTLKNVHVCCEGCQKAIMVLFKEATVTFEGTGALRRVKVAGKDLTINGVVKTLQTAGFCGSP
jgi:copper chaperone CopZ